MGTLGSSWGWQRWCWLLGAMALLLGLVGCTSKEAEQTVQRWVEAIRQRRFEEARSLYPPRNFPAGSHLMEQDFARALEEGTDVKYEMLPGIDPERVTVVIHTQENNRQVRWLFRVEKSSADKIWRIISMRRYFEGA